MLPLVLLLMALLLLWLLLLLLQLRLMWVEYGSLLALCAHEVQWRAV